MKSARRSYAPAERLPLVERVDYALDHIGQYERDIIGLRSHIRAALNIGFSQDQIIEVFMHLMFYGGIPFAREAMDVANDIFING